MKLGTSQAGRVLLERAFHLPNPIAYQIRATVLQYRSGQTWYKNPSTLQVTTLAHLLETTHPEWGCILGSDWARLEPRSSITKPLSENRIVCANFWTQRHSLNSELEDYLKHVIKVADVFIRGSAEQTTGQKLDTSTAGRLLLLQKIMNNDYDPCLGITREDALYCPSGLVSLPLQRLKRDLQVCGLYATAREINPRVD